MHRRTRALSVLVAVAVVAVSAFGCSALEDTSRSHTRGRAERIGAVLEQRRIGSIAALLHWATGENPDHYESVALVADDDGEAQRLVLRITEVDGTPTMTAKSWTACYQYRFDHWSFADGPDQVDCPDSPVIVPPPVPVPPTLPDGALDTVLSTLQGMTPADRDDADVVRRTLEQAFADDADTAVRVARVDGSTGVAVSVAGTLECVMARSKPVEAWVPPRVLVQPGEIGCAAAAAARGAAQHSPH